LYQDGIPAPAGQTITLSFPGTISGQGEVTALAASDSGPAGSPVSVQSFIDSSGTLTLPPLLIGPSGRYSLRLTAAAISNGSGASSASVTLITCASILKDAVKRQSLHQNICATFTPNHGFTLKDAADLCHFKDFDWVQQITHQNNPSEFFARNIGGGFDPAIVGPVRLTSARVPWSDPPAGGGYTPATPGEPPDFSFPFYYEPVAEVATHEDGSSEPACTLPNAGAGRTLTFHDAPSDGCLRGGFDVGKADCDFTSEPKGSYGGYQTHLAGVNFDGTATPIGTGFMWTSTYNGTTGGIHIKKTGLAADDNGTGGVTILSVIDDSGGTTINGAPPGGFPALTYGNACDGTFTGAFTGDVIISAGQSCTFVNGNIIGNVRQKGGNLVLTATQVSGNVNIRDGSAFSTSSFTVIGGNFVVKAKEGDEEDDDKDADDKGGDHSTGSVPSNTPPNQICGTIVQGDLRVRRNTIVVQIGSDSDTSCAGNLVGGDLEVVQNRAPIAIFASSVVGDLEVEDNSGGTAIFNNIVSGALRCENNSAITGSGNDTRRKHGQCSSF
jgi:hypothetical protein